MNVLVTGGTGFLGSRLALKLNELGYQVTAIGRNEAAGHKLANDNIHFVRCDLRDTEQVFRLCRDKDYVFHCGALSSPWGKYKDFYDINVGGTHNVIEGSKKAGIKRLIHVSTPSIYFDMKDKWNIAESDPLPIRPINHYAKTKLMAEQLCDAAYKAGLPVIGIRPRGLFGPGDTSIIPRLIRANSKFGVPIINKGKALVDVTYVDNVVDSLIRCKDSDNSTLGKMYNITNGEPMYFIDLIERVFRQLNLDFRPRMISFDTAYRVASMMELMSKTILFGKEPILTKYSVGVLAKSQTLSIKAAQEELGYQPRISIEQGIEQFARWWSEASHDK
ncbi:NAD-dependent epimerase/dehydratase family protein [Paenibacillus caui]|uniref:NAD-dependent epimerase/dehydratase family protein n=1 Tax=Paenibacillus caui TaxID=2873927 RepID=UPI001CA882CC|nr:NAD(P)-dependent oxidoreductase [Paenibacillus caui]